MGADGIFYYIFPLNLLTNGWFRTYKAVGRFLGSTWKMRSSRSTMHFSLVFNSYLMVLRYLISMFSMTLREDLFLR